MPSLRDKVMAVFSVHSELEHQQKQLDLPEARSLAAPDHRASGTVRQGRRHGPPSQHKSHPAGSLSSSQPGLVISLAFVIIGNNSSKIKERKIDHSYDDLIHAPCPSPPPCYLTVSLL
jgi:hypothetical protein